MVMHRYLRPWPLIAAIIALTFLLARSTQPPSDPAGAVGFVTGDPIPSEPEGAIRSPSGRVVRRGEMDDLGYILPLDVRRPRPPFEKPPEPTRSEILARREARAAISNLFEEHRLSPDDGHTQNETAIDVRGDTVVAGWNQYTDTALVMGVAHSLDGGHTWTSSAISGHTNLSDPVVKAGGNGVWYFAYIAVGGVGGSDLEVFVRRSTDGGATWGAPVAVTSDNDFDDKPYMDARADEVLVGYADFGFSPAKVRAARSTDGGLSFSHDVILANNSVGGNGACPVIHPTTGTYYMFWRDSFQDSLWMSRSTDQGVSWSPDRGIVAMNPLPSPMPGGFRMVNLPSAAADPVSGDLIVVWNDQRFGDPDILSIRSSDGGTSWSAPIRVNDDSGGASQFFPWIDFDPTGVGHVCWYDRRENGFDIDVYYSRSSDRGMSYEPNVRVTAQAFTPILPWDSSIRFIGDYNGIAASASTVYPFYQDSREGNQDVYVSLLPGISPTALPGTRPAPSVTVLTATPSPFSETVLLRSGAHPGAEVQIVNVEGRPVRRLKLGADGTVRWDGRGESGRLLPGGVYLARLPVAGGVVRLVKLD
jgi:hypothetical protein